MMIHDYKTAARSLLEKEFRRSPCLIYNDTETEPKKLIFKRQTLLQA
jgi:hypothetical protein